MAKRYIIRYYYAINPISRDCDRFYSSFIRDLNIFIISFKQV
jgi:hypothetical protein